MWPVKRPAKNAPPRALSEVWFAGVHSDVSGTFEDQELADIAFKWMVTDAVAWHLLAKDEECAAALAVQREFAHGRIHDMGRTWPLLGYRRRQVPAGARVHASVQDRVARDPAYGKKPPGQHECDDPQWHQAGTSESHMTTPEA